MGRLLYKKKVEKNSYVYLNDYTRFTPIKKYIYLECYESTNFLLLLYKKTTISGQEYMIVKKDENIVVKQDILNKALANKIIKLLES